jgi:hypothetical protein
VLDPQTAAPGGRRSDACSRSTSARTAAMGSGLTIVDGVDYRVERARCSASRRERGGKDDVDARAARAASRRGASSRGGMLRRRDLLASRRAAAIAGGSSAMVFQDPITRCTDALRSAAAHRALRLPLGARGKRRERRARPARGGAGSRILPVRFRPFPTSSRAECDSASRSRSRSRAGRSS